MLSKKREVDDMLAALAKSTLCFTWPVIDVPETHQTKRTMRGSCGYHLKDSLLTK